MLSQARTLRVASVLLVTLLGMSNLRGRAQVAPGDRFPSLGSAASSGGELPAAEGHVLLVDFWASWCGPCKASFPALARLHSEFGARGLVIVGVGVDEKRAAYAAFVKKLAPPFTTIFDADQKIVQSVKVPAMPSSYLIGRDGRVRFVHQGFHGAETENELRTQIALLLTEPAHPSK